LDDFHPLDPVLNVVLFLPVGFLFALTRSANIKSAGPGSHRLVWQATALGFVASSAIELTQVFEPGRYPSPLDVATNTLGAALGAWLFRRASRRLGADTPLVGRLALELPLMGLVYLLVPLCALAALTVGAGAHIAGSLVPQPRSWGFVALALFGGTLLGRVQRRHFGPAGTLTARQISLAAAGWFAAGALPALATAPVAFAAGAAAAAIAAWAHGRPRTVDQAMPINRRFELQALASGVPWFGAYLALLPLTHPGDAGRQLQQLDLLVLVETVAAFTVLGYVLAEAWGRLELRYRHTAWRVALAATSPALASVLLRTMTFPDRMAAAETFAYVVAAAYGGWIYHLQRAHVRALVDARQALRSAPAARTHDAPSAMQVRRRA
jgi:hypothetical protein